MLICIHSVPEYPSIGCRGRPAPIIAGRQQVKRNHRVMLVLVWLAAVVVDVVYLVHNIVLKLQAEDKYKSQSTTTNSNTVLGLSWGSTILFIVLVILLVVGYGWYDYWSSRAKSRSEIDPDPKTPMPAPSTHHKGVQAA